MQRADLEGQGQSTPKGRVQLPVLGNVQAKKSQHEIEIEQELARFEAEQREALGLEKMKTHWVDENPQRFTGDQRAHTTLLLGGLTLAHDYLITAALSGLGYKVQTLDCPDNAALQLGKEFGNRAQCNPTYFTVGN